MFKPLEIFNDLVTGIILGLYDFITLIIGPLLAPFSKRRLRTWRSLLRIEEKLNSLTILFICVILLVAVLSGNLQVGTRYLVKSDETSPYSFVFLLTFSLFATIVLDIFCRFLVAGRSLVLRVRYSYVRLNVLRLTLSAGLFAVFFVEAFTVLDLRVISDEFDLATLIASVALIPFAFSLTHLTRRLPSTFRWCFTLPFSYFFLRVVLLDGVIVAFGVWAFTKDLFDDVRIYTFNPQCILMDDKKTVVAEFDILLKSDIYDAVALQTEYLHANVDEKASAILNQSGEGSIIIRKNIPAHLKLKGVFPNQESLEVSGKIPCTLDAEKTSYVQLPKRLPTWEARD
jgi:hypothetical protein